MANYIGRRIVPRHDGIWDPSREYEELVIVLHEETGVSYLSRKPVPAGTEIYNTAYWSVCSQFSEQVRLAEENLNQTAKDVTEKMEAAEVRINEGLSATKKSVEESLSHTTDTLTKTVEAAREDLETGRAAMDQNTAVLNARMDTIASGTTEDTEVLDARVDSSGETHASLGDHLRSKAQKYYANGLPFSYVGPVNINTTDCQVEFPGNFIYLGANGNRLLTAPDPVPYNPEALLTYLCFDTVNRTLVTYDWSESPMEEDVVMFVVDCKAPIRSYGQFPFQVDGKRPFAAKTLTAEMLEDGSVQGAKLADGAVTTVKLEDAAVSAKKLAPDALMSHAFDLEVSPCVYFQGKYEVLEDGAYHYYLDEYEQGYSGGGIKVARASRFDKLYIQMDYCNEQRMQYYVTGSKLVNLGTIAGTGGEVQTVNLEIPSAKLEEAGYTDDFIQVMFTTNTTYDMTIAKVRAHYFNIDASYFGEDYSKLHTQTDTNTEQISLLSETASGLSEQVLGLREDTGSLQEKMEALSGQQALYMGKKILFLGDSITALGTSERGWVRYFNEIIQPSLSVNLAVSSARWCDYSDTVYDGNPVFSGPDQNHNNVMGNQVEKLLRGKDTTHPSYSQVDEYQEFDMILIACGTNDGLPSGEIEPSFTAENEVVAIEELDRTGFASAFRYSIEKLQGMYPDARIFICTPIQGYITTRSYTQTKQKGDYLKLLAGRMSLPVIDTFCCGICDIYEKKNANGRYLIDGLHPNAAGAKRMGLYNAAAVAAMYR